MADIKYMKAVEWDKLPAAFKKANSQRMAAHAGMWLQRKYDGCFGKAEISVDRGKCRMVSRTGEDYSASCRHILNDLHDAASDMGSFDPFCVLGEVWAEGIDFPTISGWFRTQTKGAQRALCFVMHDMLTPDMQTAYNYSSRFGNVEELVRDCVMPNLRVAATYRCGEWDGDPLEWAITWKAEGGYDGAILRDPTKGYTFGLVKNGEIIKVKPVLSLDIRCLGYAVETGEKTGRPVYTIRVEYQGVITAVGSGVPHAFDKVPRKGQIVQIDCMGLTEDGRLREPRFITNRSDKDTPDE
jgi:DNA ligase-1